MPNMSPYKTPMPTQEPQKRCQNFFEVATGYTEEMAIEEANTSGQARRRATRERLEPSSVPGYACF